MRFFADGIVEAAHNFLSVTVRDEARMHLEIHQANLSLRNLCTRTGHERFLPATAKVLAGVQTTALTDEVIDTLSCDSSARIRVMPPCASLRASLMASSFLMAIWPDDTSRATPQVRPATTMCAASRQSKHRWARRHCYGRLFSRLFLPVSPISTSTVPQSRTQCPAESRRRGTDVRRPWHRGDAWRAPPTRPARLRGPAPPPLD